MNEIRDLIVGIDFGQKYTQICYYDRKADEPNSLSLKVGSAEYESPTCLCKRAQQGDYHIGLEALYFSRERDGILLDDFYAVSNQEEEIRLAEDVKQPYELLAIYLKGLLKFLGILEIVKNTKCLAITMPNMSQIQVKNWMKACQAVGFPPEKFLLLDYDESFFYYVYTQKKEIWNRNVGWYSFDNNQVEFRSFEVNDNARPVQIRLKEAVSTSLPEESKERDRAFKLFVKETLKGDAFSSLHINGKGFDQSWSKDSLRLLCYQRRRVYYGNNLFAKGACSAGMERKEKKNLKNIRYMSDSMVSTSIGMEMLIMGAKAYHPLIEAGYNWYECNTSCEMILDDTEELIFHVTDEKGDKRKISMALSGLPKRPNKTTRISLNLQYISGKECLITVRDLGFGELFPSSGKVWKERTRWQGGEA